MRESRKRLAAILSLSMATALVGAGISPALNAISQYFTDSPPLAIQMVVSLPSLLMVLVALVFSQISNRVSMRDICVAGLVLYTIGGVWGYAADSMAVMLFTRVLIGAGSGLLMPMSVGLLSYFYNREEQQRLNGYIVVLTSIISIISMVLVGYIASVSWRGCFLVYLFGVPCIWLSWKYIPATILKSPRNRVSLGLLKRIWPYAVGIFSMTVLYFAMLNNCSGIVTAEGTVDAAYVGVVMSVQTVASLLTGVFLEQIQRFCGRFTKYVIWGTGLLSMAALCVPNNLPCLLVGLFALGVGLAMAVGLFNAHACMACHREESLSVMSVISFTRCLGQFSSPVILTGAQALLGMDGPRFPYYACLILAVVMFLLFIPVRMSAET